MSCDEYMTRPDAIVYAFLASSHVTHPHFVHGPHMDNRVLLMPKDFVVKDGSIAYKTARCTAVCAISGGSKSPVLDEADNEISNDVFKGHCTRSTSAAVRELAGGKWRYEKGGSTAAFIKSAAENQGPCGARGILEEAGAMFNKFPIERDGSKMSISDYIKLFNAVLDIGKHTITRGDDKAQNFRFVLSMGIQRTQLHFFLPFTSQGESYRPDVLLSPIGDALTQKRANKTTDKTNSLGYTQA